MTSDVKILTTESRAADTLTCAFTPAEADVIQQLLRLGFNATPQPLREPWVTRFIERLARFSHAKTDYPEPARNDDEDEAQWIAALLPSRAEGG